MTSLRPRPPRVSAALLVLSALRCAGALRPSLRFPGLQAASFQHPVDEQALARLRDTAPLQLASRLLQPVVGAMARSELGADVVGGDLVDGRLTRLLHEAAEVLDIEHAPELFVRRTSMPNAYAFAGVGEPFEGAGGPWAERHSRPFIVVTTGLLQVLDDDELRCVMAHELGHCKCQHGNFMCLAHVLTGAVSFVMGPGVAEVHRRALLQWQRCAELSSDRAALLVAQDEKVVISALSKLAAQGRPRGAGKAGRAPGAELPPLDGPKAWADRLMRGDTLILLDALLASGRTHPMLQTRQRHILDFVRSDTYRDLLASAAPVSPTAAAGGALD